MYIYIEGMNCILITIGRMKHTRGERDAPNKSMRSTKKGTICAMKYEAAMIVATRAPQYTQAMAIAIPLGAIGNRQRATYVYIYIYVYIHIYIHLYI